MKDEKIQAAAPICPNCGRAAQGTVVTYGIKSHIRWDCWACRTRAWDNKPMVSRLTLRARQAAHEAFDPLWQQKAAYTSEDSVRKLLARSRAYKLLAEELGLEEPEVHMGDMTEEVAVKVPDAVTRIRERLSLRNQQEINRDYRERGKEIAETRRRKKLI